MAWLHVANVLRQAVPLLAKQLPKLWPLLLEKNTRTKLLEAGKDLASQSPTRKLRGRIEVVATLADRIAEGAKTDEERATASEWTRRANNLGLRLEMPVQGHKSKVEHRASIKAQLDELQSEMNDHLGR